MEEGGGKACLYGGSTVYKTPPKVDVCSHIEAHKWPSRSVYSSWSLRTLGIPCDQNYFQSISKPYQVLLRVYWYLFFHNSLIIHDIIAQIK